MAKIDDEKRKKKKQLIIIIGVIVIIAILTVIISVTRPKVKPKPVQAVKTVTNSTTLAQESWIAKSQAKMENLQKELQQLKEAQKQESITNKQPNMNTNTLGLVPNQPNSNSTLSGTVNYPPPPAPTTPPPSLPQSNAKVCPNNEPNCNVSQPPEPTSRQEEDLIGVVTPMQSQEQQTQTNKTNIKTDNIPMPNKQTNVPSNSSESSKVSPMSYEIPPGSFVNAYLLTGADVPTSGNGEVGPIPVVFRVIGDAQMPNLYKSDIKSCFMLGQATGSLASERAYIRVNTLSCITKSGKDIVKSMQGYVTGADGKVGLAGVVVSKQGSMLARALVAGFLQGIGQAFQQSETNLSISPLGSTSSVAPNSSTLLRYGIGGGVGQATTKLAEFYMKMANQMFPVIVINAGRTGNVIFLKGVKL